MNQIKNEKLCDGVGYDILREIIKENEFLFKRNVKGIEANIIKEVKGSKIRILSMGKPIPKN